MQLRNLLRRNRQSSPPAGPSAPPPGIAANKRTTIVHYPNLPVYSLSVGDLAIVLAGQTEIHRIFELAGQWLLDRAGLTHIVIYEHDPAANNLANPMVAGGELSAPLPEKVRFGSGLVGDVALNRIPYFVESVNHEKRLNPKPGGAQSAYVLPLVYEATLFGVMVLYSNRDQALSDPARAAFDRVAGLVSALLANARRLTDAKQAIERFDRFQELAKDLTARLSSQELLQRIVDAACEMLDAQMSILLNLDEASGDLRPIAWSGINDQTAMLIRSRYKQDLKGLVAWAKRPARTPDLRVDQRTALATQAVAAGMVSELAVPVLYTDDLYGILAVETNLYRHFTDEEMSLLSALAAQAGIALHNARLFEEIQKRNGLLEKANADLVISQQQAENARATAVQANRLKTEFINNMSHELRTPLNAVINFTRLVKDGHAGEVTEQQVSYLTFVHDSGQHLLGLINDILDLAKIEAGKMELRREPTALEPLFKGVMSTLVGLTRDKGLNLMEEIEPDLPLVDIDGRRIRQVLLNLVSNAAKFTEKGSITLRAARQERFVIVAVRDTGVGIRADDLSMVFEEFQQIDNPLQEAAAGSGLGMPISRRFVRLHGGDMWIESQLGVGTSVYFSLPIA